MEVTVKNVLVTGGSKGIGLEFARQYLGRGCRVFAASRNPSDSAELGQLQKEYGEQLAVYPLDVGDMASRRDFHASLTANIDGLDLLINNAGIVSGNEEFLRPLGELDQEELSKTFLTNSIAPLMMVDMALPLLKKAAKPIVVNMSSDNGSISRKNRGGKYGYSASKAALNMITKILSYDLKDQRIIVICFHPGWVKTPMTRNEPAPLEPAESIGGMMRVIDSLEMEDTGKFLDWKGEEVPW
jgi:NAD(P)-dependent dehydrogenase (short-subunit alcohol dehydrogenase family)